jgi:hypothetical protein
VEGESDSADPISYQNAVRHRKLGPKWSEAVLEELRLLHSNDILVYIMLEDVPTGVKHPVQDGSSRSKHFLGAELVTAFLNPEVDDDYMAMPDGMKCLRVGHRFAYCTRLCLKQAPRLWYEHYDNFPEILRFSEIRIRSERLHLGCRPNNDHLATLR